MISKRLQPLFVSAALSSVLFSLATGFAGGRSAFAQSSLPPGTTSGPPVPTISTGTPPFSDTLLQEATSPLFGTNGTNIISGSVTSAAFQNTSGFLDFFYQFTFDNNTNINVNTISLSSFANVPGVLVGQTSEDVDGGGLPAQNLGGTVQNSFTSATSTGSYSSANRPSVDGDSINATLLTGVTKNQTTFTMVIRTQATGFSLAGSASVQGGGISAFTVSQGAIAPLPVASATAPEPSPLALLALGMAVPLAGAIRYKHRRV
jgi:hypothetical protein